MPMAVAGSCAVSAVSASASASASAPDVGACGLGSHTWGTPPKSKMACGLRTLTAPGRSGRIKAPLHTLASPLAQDKGLMDDAVTWNTPSMRLASRPSSLRSWCMTTTQGKSRSGVGRPSGPRKSSTGTTKPRRSMPPSTAGLALGMGLIAVQGTTSRKALSGKASASPATQKPPRPNSSEGSSAMLRPPACHAGGQWFWSRPAPSSAGHRWRPRWPSHSPPCGRPNA